MGRGRVRHDGKGWWTDGGGRGFFFLGGGGGRGRKLRVRGGHQRAIAARIISPILLPSLPCL